MNKHKKAQITISFNYITAIVIIGVLLLFGTISVTKLMGNIKDVESQKFRSDFKRSIDDASTSIYSIQKVELSGLNDFKKVCFVDFKNRGLVANNSLLVNEYPLIRGYLSDSISNIFLIGEDLEDNFLNEKISIERNEVGIPSDSFEIYYICKNVSRSGTIDLILTGLGKSVKLELNDD